MGGLSLLYLEDACLSDCSTFLENMDLEFIDYMNFVDGGFVDIKASETIKIDEQVFSLYKSNINDINFDKNMLLIGKVAILTAMVCILLNSLK
jgi:Tfp pilus assembly protein PilZ